MQQLTQQLKSGKMELLEVPLPLMDKGQILVRNIFSAISAGTEGKTVSDARKGYISKARSRKKEFNQVIEMIKSKGLFSTYKFVMNKLELPSSLGYSCAGEVIAIGDGVKKVKVGDLVACGGKDAVHAEIVSVHENLCVKLPANIDVAQASLVSIAAIAIQGIRQSGATIGESSVIIGMGLIGQITYKILEAAGVFPIGIDISESQIQLALNTKIKNIYNRNSAGLEEIILNHTKGHGADSVIITASGDSIDPVEFAGKIARKKANIVVVGNVPTGFSRNDYYKKELNLKMSSSYGPGRYDTQYEEGGIDYPVGYVRWTENRNMESYIDLLASGNIDLSGIISHKFNFDDATLAYNMIMDKNEPYSGILIEYDQIKNHKKKEDKFISKNNNGKINVSFAGAGSFAQSMLLPGLKNKVNLIGVLNRKGNTSRYVGDKFGFSKCYDTAEELFSDELSDTVFIATRHNLHKEYIIKGLESGKNIFVEKPIAILEDDLIEIKECYEKLELKPHFMVGFNRRFSPAVKEIRNIFKNDIPLSINIRVNAGSLPVDHWVNDPEIGGGRIIGEAVHFVDLALFLAGSKIKSVTANAMDDSGNLRNSVSVILDFENGSIASINYLSNGNSKLSKERIEVSGGGVSTVIDDFNLLTIYDNGIKKIKFKAQDKGHSEEIKAFINSIEKNQDNAIPFEEIYMSTYATFLVVRSIKEGRKIYID